MQCPENHVYDTHRHTHTHKNEQTHIYFNGIYYIKCIRNFSNRTTQLMEYINVNGFVSVWEYMWRQCISYIQHTQSNSIHFTSPYIFFSHMHYNLEQIANVVTQSRIFTLDCRCMCVVVVC